MAVDKPIRTGYDPTSDPEITGAELKQMIDEATFASGHGGTVIGATVPDTANNEYMKRCLWIDTRDSANVVVRQYNETSGGWDPIGLAASSVGNDHIIDKSINPVGKLDPTAGAAREVLRINAADNSFELVSPNTLFNTGEIGITKIEQGVWDGEMIIMSGGSAIWKKLTATDINGFLGAGGLTVNRITPGTANYLLRTSADGSTVEWAPASSFVTLSAIQAALAFNKLGFDYLELAAADQVPVMNAGATAWTFVDKDSLLSSPQFDSLTGQNVALNTLQSSGINHFAHTAAKIPEVVNCYLRCTSNDAGSLWNAGDCIDISNVFAGGALTLGQDHVPAISVIRSSGNVSLYTNKEIGGSSQIWMPKNDPNNSVLVKPSATSNFSVYVDILWLA